MSGQEKIERMVIKIPASVADYFREAFPHGRRSEFVAACILDYKRKKEIAIVEEQLKAVRKKRQ